MIVQLERVVLAGSAGAATGGLSVRIDRTRPAVDWTRGSVDLGLGAYALAPTTGQKVNLQAQFSFPDMTGLTGSSVIVRAKTADPDTMPFGGVGPAAVAVPAAGKVTPLMSLPLNQVRLLERGVGKYEVTLRWQFQTAPAAPWVDFDASTHVVYVTLDVPGTPWTQATSGAGQRNCPWARVLDWSCLWAQGITITDGDVAGAIDKAARRIEAGIYSLGQRDEVPLQYLDAGGGGAYATELPGQVAFLCTKFLRLLAGDTAPEIETSVDCSDCTAALVAFANVLGCDLSSERVVPADTTFQTNQVVAIGRKEDNPRGYGFGYHEVAGRGPDETTFRVFDACLMIDRDADPSRDDDSHSFGLAQGLTLTTATLHPARLRYVHRLVKETSWPVSSHAGPSRCLDECDGSSAPVDPITGALHQQYLDLIHSSLLEPSTGRAKIDLEAIPLPGFVAYHRNLETPQFSALEPLVKQWADFYYVASPGRERKARVRTAKTMPDRRLRLCVGSSDSPTNAQDALAWVLAQSAVRLALFTEAGKPVLGDVAFAGPREGSIFFVRGNSLAWLSNAGPEPAALRALATTVDDAVRRTARRRHR